MESPNWFGGASAQVPSTPSNYIDRIIVARKNPANEIGESPQLPGIVGKTEAVRLAHLAQYLMGYRSISSLKVANSVAFDSFRRR